MTWMLRCCCGRFNNQSTDAVMLLLFLALHISAEVVSWIWQKLDDDTACVVMQYRPSHYNHFLRKCIRLDLIDLWNKRQHVQIYFLAMASLQVHWLLIYELLQQHDHSTNMKIVITATATWPSHQQHHHHNNNTIIITTTAPSSSQQHQIDHHNNNSNHNVTHVYLHIHTSTTTSIHTLFDVHIRNQKILCHSDTWTRRQKVYIFTCKKEK